MHLMDFSIFSMKKSISLIGIGLSTVLVTTIFFLDKTDFSWLFNKLWKLPISRKTNFFLRGICLICLFVITFATKETNSLFYIFYFWMVAIIWFKYFYLKKYNRAMIVAIVASFSCFHIF